jgi:hypothetical protein
VYVRISKTRCFASGLGCNGRATRPMKKMAAQATSEQATSVGWRDRQLAEA